MAPINKLPPELVIGITDHLDDVRDIAALVPTSKKFYFTCNQILYSRGNQIPGLKALPLGWGAWHRNLGTVKNALAAGADPNHRFVTVKLFPTLPRRLSNRPANRSPDISNTGSDGDGESDGASDGTGSEHDWDEDGDEDDEQDEDDDSESGFTRSNDLLGSCWSDPRFRARPKNYTALHIAVYRAATPIIETLLDHGANINAAAQDYCICDGPLESNLPSWYERKAYERTRSPMPYIRRRRPIETPIHIAMCRAQLGAAKVLVKRGADLLSKNSQGLADGSSAIFLAARYGYVDLLKAMLESNDNYQRDLLGAQDTCSLTPLHHACISERWYSSVPFLLQHGASLDKTITINHVDFQIRTTMLREACYTGDFLQAIRLLDLGAGVTQGVTITHRGPSITAIPSWNHVANEPLPLLHACCHEPEGPMLAALPLAIKRLVEAGASLEEKWGDMTALHFAARSNLVPAVRTLLELGAKTDSYHYLSMTPLMSAILENAHERRLDRASQGHPPRYPSILPMEQMNFVRRPVLPVVRCLLEFGASVHDRNVHQATALHQLFQITTTQYDNNYRKDNKIITEVGRLLLRHGVDPCAKDNANRTAFRAAFEVLDLPMCREMLQTHRAEILESLKPADIQSMFLHANTVKDGQHCKAMEALDFILDLDTKECICSDKSLFLGLFRTRDGDLFHAGMLNPETQFAPQTKRMWSSEYNCCMNNLLVANTIFSHGISERMGLTPNDWTVVLIGLILYADFREVRDFLAVAIREADLNLVDAYGKTIISYLLCTPSKWTDNAISPNHTLITDLIDAGADVYMPLTFLDTDAPIEKTETPLHVALRDAVTHSFSSRYKLAEDRLEYILRTRPIPARQPKASKCRPYLHYALEHMDIDKAAVAAETAPISANIIKLLLDHNVNIAERDENLDTALTVWISLLITYIHHRDEDYDWDNERLDFRGLAMIIKMLEEPLSVADVNAKNKDGKSAIDLAEDLLLLLSERDRFTGRGKYFEVVRAASPPGSVKRTEEGVKMIRWL